MEISLVDGRLYLCQCRELLLGGQMNYWERRKSFWTTSKGFVIQIAAVLIILCGAIIGLNLYISPFPVIESFEAKPVALTLGEASNLSWSVVGATFVEIDQGIGRVSLKGDLKISPLKTTTYSLTAINGTRNRTKLTKVIVEQ
jgi:hypothetical protein